LLSMSAGIVPWDERLGVHVTHLMWGTALLAMGTFVISWR